LRQPIAISLRYCENPYRVEPSVLSCAREFACRVPRPLRFRNRDPQLRPVSAFSCRGPGTCTRSSPGSRRWKWKNVLSARRQEKGVCRGPGCDSLQGIPREGRMVRSSNTRCKNLRPVRVDQMMVKTA